MGNNDVENNRDPEVIILFILMLVSIFILIYNIISNLTETSVQTGSPLMSIYSQHIVDKDEAILDINSCPTINSYIGEFKLTVYTPHESHWGYQTATGEKSQHLMTCAVDPKVIPYGSTIIINGVEFLAIDCGPGIKGYRIDIFYDGSETEGIKWLDKFIGKDKGDGYIIKVYSKTSNIKPGFKTIQLVK